MDDVTRLEVIPPYDFHLTTSVFSRFTTQVADYYLGGKYLRVLVENDKPHLVEISSKGTIHEPKINARVINPPTSSLSSKLLSEIIWILGTQYDLKPFYKKLKQDSKMQSLGDSLYGLKPPRSPSMFEALIVAITEQRISLSVAMRLREKLAQRYGVSVQYEEREYLGFPTPSKLAQARIEDIQALGFNRQKASAINVAANLVTSGELNLDVFRDYDIDESVNQLTAIKGIGPWTVQYMLCRGAGRYDAVPHDDIALKRGIAKWYGKDFSSDNMKVRKLLTSFGEYSGYAAFYLIFSYAYDKYSLRLQL